MAYREADVFLLCYKITEPSSLFNALNHWCPEIKAVAPSTPVILVGCQSDLRKNREILSNLAKQGRAPISPEQALTFSQQINALMYVETSAKTSTRAAISAFEVAGLASMGKLSKPRSPRLVNHLLPLDDSCQTSKILESKDFCQTFYKTENFWLNSQFLYFRSTPSPKALNKKQRYSTTSPQNSLERAADEDENSHDESTEHFWDRLGSPKVSESPRTASLSSSSRSASLSSKSIPSISSLGCKTPKSLRKNSSLAKDNKVEKTMTIKCQRLTADRTYEEIEVEVPVPIYETIQLYNDTGSLAARGHKERRSFGAKLKNLFTKWIPLPSHFFKLCDKYILFDEI